MYTLNTAMSATTSHPSHSENTVPWELRTHLCDEHVEENNTEPVVRVH